MRPGKELQEDGRINRQVPSDSHRPQRRKHRNGREIGRSGSNKTKHRGDANGQVESPPPAKDVTPKTPEDGAEQKPYVLREGEHRRPGGSEFIGHGCQYQRSDHRPQIVACPAESDDNEELPLVAAHANGLDGIVQYMGFGRVDGVHSILWERRDCYILHSVTRRSINGQVLLKLLVGGVGHDGRRNGINARATAHRSQQELEEQ